MKDRIILAVVLASVMGSAAVSASSLSQTIKSGYHAAAASVLLAVGVHGIYTYLKKRKIEKTA